MDDFLISLLEKNCQKVNHLYQEYSSLRKKLTRSSVTHLQGFHKISGMIWAALQLPLFPYGRVRISFFLKRGFQQARIASGSFRSSSRYQLAYAAGNFSPAQPGILFTMS
jgi:hypothetical protein